jgi:hypothetical protein
VDKVKEGGMFRANGHGSKTRLRRGDLVEVCPAGEILRTLDARGKLDGLPFMPEMAPYCGEKFRVYRRADKVFLDRHYVARMRETVLLEDLRCDGQAHGGCGMQCLLLWKEAWLRPAEAAEGREGPDRGRDCPSIDALPTQENGRFSCQATELIGAATRLPGWDPRQYLRDLLSRDVGVGQLGMELGLLVYNQVRHLLGRRPHGTLCGNGEDVSSGELNLRRGELVEVKSRREIAATLDASGRTRGLAFTPEMAIHCGRTYRVGGRVDKLILEWSGAMRQVPSTVILEDVTCRGIGARLCPRSCYLLWREAWLKQVADRPVGPPGEAAR